MAKPPNEYMLTRLRLVAMSEDSEAQARADAAFRGRSHKRKPLAHLAKPDRTFYALEKRGLVFKRPPPEGSPAGVWAWNITHEGREALEQ